MHVRWDVREALVVHFLWFLECTTICFCFRSLTLVFVVTGVFGSSVLYILLAAENSHSLLGHAGVNLSPCLWMVIVAVILLPLSWFGSPKDFWYEFWYSFYQRNSSFFNILN